jgi:hypothetical protein
MDNFFGAIGHFFKHIAVFVSDSFVKLFGSDAAHTFAVGALSLLKTDLGKIATEAVQEAENVAAGVDKYGFAFAKIVAAATAAGLDAKESIINMLIELAVQALKGAFGPKDAAAVQAAAPKAA